MTAQVTSEHHGNNETDLEGMLSKHHELKTEIDTMQKNFENFDTSGEDLLSGQHYAAEIIKEKLEELREGWNVLLRSWENRTEEIQKRKKAENMNREVSQLEAWLLNQEAELSLNEVGNGLDNVEDLLKKHDEMERMLLAQEERFLSLIQPSNDEQGYNVATEGAPNQENEASDIEHVHDPTGLSSASDNLSVNPSHEMNSMPKPVQFDGDLTEKSFASDDFSTSNIYDTEETNKLFELNSMPDLPNYDLQGDGVMESDQLPELDSAASDWMIDQNDDDTKVTEEATMVIDAMPINAESSRAKAAVPDVFVDKGAQETSDLELDAEAGKLDNGSTTVSDESTSSNVFNERTKRNSPKLQDTKNIYKEPMSASQRILGVSPLCSGILKRKQETDVSGQRSVAQPWRSYYTVLSEDILQFFKDVEGFKSKWHISKPMGLVGAFCEQVKESSRQGYIFRVIFRDKSEYLFTTENEEECKLWVTKINSVIKMAARFGSSGDGHGYYGENTSSHGGHNDGGAYDHVHHIDGDSDGDSDGAGHKSDDMHSGKGEDFDDGGRYGQVYHGDSDGDHDDDGSRQFGNDDIDNDIKPDKSVTSSNLKEPHPYTSDTPMIVITDTNSNNEFLVEDETYTDQDYSSSDQDALPSDEDIQLSDEDAISLPEYCDYERPSWYPTPLLDRNDMDSIEDKGSTPDNVFVITDKPDSKISHQNVCELRKNDDTLDKAMDESLRDVFNVEDSFFKSPPPLPSTSPSSYPDIDSITPPGKPSARIFKAKDNKADDSPPPIPSTPPPLAPDLKSDLPSDLPEIFPPEVVDDNLSDLLDFIPPPVLDPSFDFLVETKDEVSITEVWFQNDWSASSLTRQNFQVLH